MLIYLDLLLLFLLFVFVNSCAWNHYFYSGFRHMSKNHPTECVCVCAWNHYKNSGFRHRTEKSREPTHGPPPSPKQKKSICWSAEPKKWDFCAKISRFVEGHRDLSQISHFSFFVRRVSETPIFEVFSGLHEAGSSKNALFWKPLKTRDRQKIAFSTYLP